MGQRIMHCIINDDQKLHPNRRRLQLLAGLCVLGTGVGTTTYLLNKPTRGFL